jgi:predicted Zn-dependent protease with MMP-like domain
MDDGGFLSLVEEVLEEVLQDLAGDLGAKLDNVEISIEDWPTNEVLRELGVPAGGTLLGLYRGVPQTDRSVFQMSAFPDRIILYQGPLELEASNPKKLRKIVRHTILHEIAHHFGISDERLVELGAY